MYQGNKIDKRVIKTKDSLKRALVKLLIDNKLENVSIIALTNAAEINRKTFYLHYKDVASVYKEITGNLCDKIINQIISTSWEEIENENTIYNVLSIIENDEFVVSLLKDTIYAKRITSLIESVIIENIYNKYLQKHLNNNSKQVYTIIEFNVYGCMRVFLNWIKGKENTDLRDLSKGLSLLTYKVLPQ